MHFIFGQQITHRLSSLDVDGTEVFFEYQLLDTRIRAECHLDNLSFPVRIGCEIYNFRSGSSLCHIVFTVAYHRRYIETLDIVESFFPVTINHVIDRTLVVLLEDIHVENVLAYEQLVRNTYDFIFSVFIEDNHIVDIGTVADILVFLQSRTDKSFLAVDIQFLVGLGHLGCHNRIEVSYLRTPREILSVFLLDTCIPVDGIFSNMSQMIVYFFDIRFQLGNKLVCLILVELQDTRHLYLHKLEDIFLSHFAYKLRIERCQPFVDMFACGIHVLSLFELLVLVDTLFDEDFLQRSEMQGLQRFVALDVQFLTKQRKCIVYRLTEYRTDRKEMRLLVVDDAAVGRNIHLTVGKGIQGIECLVRRNARSQVYQNLYLVGSIVVHLPYLDLTLFDSFQDRINQ